MATETLELILKARDMASGAVATLRTGMERLHEGSRQYNATLERLGATGNEFKNTMVRLAAVVGVAGVARSFIEIASSAERTKLMLAGLMGGVDKANEAFDYLLDLTTKAPFSLDSMNDAFVKLQIAGLDPMHGSLETLMDAISALGGSDEQLHRSAIAMQQMAGKGVVSMEELRQQLGEALPKAMEAMAEGMGMSMAQLSKAVEQGNVSATEGMTAMLRTLKEWYGGTGLEMMDSWTGLIATLKSEWSKFAISLSDTGIFDNLKGVISEVLAKIEEMKKSGELAEWGARISSVISTTIAIFTKLATVFGTVIETLGPFLPLIIETILYLKAMQLVFGGLIGLPLQMFANISALGDAFKAMTGKGAGLIEFLRVLRVEMSAATAATAGMSTILKATAVVAIAFAAYEMIKLVSAIYQYIKAKNDLARAEEAAAEQNEFYQESLKKHDANLKKLGMTVEELNKAISEGTVIKNKDTGEWEKFTEATKVAAKTYEDMIAAVNFGSAEFMKMREQESKTLKAQIDYEIALQEDAYKKGEISLEQYLSFKERRTEDYTNRIIYLKKFELDALKEDPEKNRDNIFAIEQEIQQIKIASAQAQIKNQQDLTKELQQEYEDDFTGWKSLQELRLQSLESRLTLQNAMEETAARQGLITQSELLAAQLDRYRQISQEKIDSKTDEIWKLADLGKQESEDFKQAYAEREELQAALQAQIIQSEQQIAEQKKAEAIEAEEFIAELLEDRFRQDEARRQEELKQLELFWEQGRISAEDYYDGLEALDKQYTSEFKRDLQERVEQLNIAINIITERRQRLEDTLNGMLTESFAEVRQYFSNWKDALSTDIDDMQAEIGRFMRQTSWTSYDTFQSATLYGRRMIEMTGTTIYEWAQQVSDYVLYVKGLMMSLQETIASYELQLMQIRGDRIGELDAWIKAEREKLDEKYKGDLGKTKEYYEALALLDELYKEKKKKILAEMENETEKWNEKSAGTGGASGGAGGIAGGLSFPSLEDFTQKIKDAVSFDIGDMAMEMASGTQQVEQTKTININMNLTAPNYDPENTQRWVNNTLYPILKRAFEVRGLPGI